MARNRVIERDRGWRLIRERLRRLDELEAKAGLQQGAKAKDLSDLVTIGAVHEFGAPNKNIPERSFLRATFDQEQPFLRRVKEDLYGQVLVGRAGPSVALRLLGEAYLNRVRARIRGRISPPLQDATRAARKGGLEKNTAPRSDLATRTTSGAVPLIDTGQLIQSLRTVVVQRGQA